MGAYLTRKCLLTYIESMVVTADREPDIGVDGGGTSGDRGYVDCPKSREHQ